MIVTKNNFADVTTELTKHLYLGLDTETFGLRTFHGDKLFSIIISTEKKPYYFNFISYPSINADFILTTEHMKLLQSNIFSDHLKTWFIQNAANFDLCVLDQDNLHLAGEIHCTKAIGRIERCDHLTYNLSDQLQRIGLKKDDTVEKYIKDFHLYSKVDIPGKSTEELKPHYNLVPFALIVPYGEMDTVGCRKLGLHQIKSILEQDESSPPDRKIQNVMRNENRLQKTIFKMKKEGILIDTEYCKKGIEYEFSRRQKAMDKFKELTGLPFVDSAKTFKEAFIADVNFWQYTKKKNPSFTSDVLLSFTSPAAKEVLTIRDAKSKADFYNGFIYHADSRNRVHANFNPEGAIHGRFSSSEPNMQNLTNEEDDIEKALQKGEVREFIVRRAIIPPPNHFVVSIDYNSLEYKFMLEQACRIVGKLTPLGELVLSGMDFHLATVENVKRQGIEVTRNQAKTVSFLTLYGGGDAKLAGQLKCSLQQARAIRDAIFNAAPEIRRYISSVKNAALERKFIINWLGRRCYFSNRNITYKAPNWHISGGCADVVKVAMNKIDDFLKDKKTTLNAMVHDELIFYVPFEEEYLIKDLKRIMESAYPHKYIPMTASISVSKKSLGDLEDYEARDEV